MRAERRWPLAWLLLLALASMSRGQDVPTAEATPRELRAGLRVGHWVRCKGAFDDRGWFVVEALEIRPPESQETLIGAVGEVDESRGRFVLHGRPVTVDERAEWHGVDWDSLPGARVEVEGHARGPTRFAARDILLRGAGRDRLEGRVDGLEHQGDELRLRLMDFDVLVPVDAVLGCATPLAELALAPEAVSGGRSDTQEEDDFIPASFALTDSLAFGAQAEWKESHERDLDLDATRPRDQRAASLSLKTEFTWRPHEDVFALARLRWVRARLRDENDPNTLTRDGSVSELYGAFRDPLGLGVDVIAGRQDFDDPREFVYDRNLDALRLAWRGEGVKLELSGSTVLTESSRADRETDNWIAYLSNDDTGRHLAAWVVDRRRGGADRSQPIHAGVRALGEWLPAQNVWAELSAVRGYEQDVDLRGWAVDVGTTVDVDPFYFTMGFAHGSGDPDPTDDVDESHRQTGLQDNNGRFGGVTSFKTYGEVMEPALSNLEIYTAGVGMRVGRRSSIDLVAHQYRLVETFLLDPAVYPDPPPLIDSKLRRRPDGLHTDLGWELDLVLGSRETESWDLELVLGLFQPGAAFPGADPAWVWRTQVRHRF